MRPRTATIEVFKAEGIWYVEIGDPLKSVPDVVESGKNLAKLLKYAIIIWKVKEGLDD